MARILTSKIETSGHRFLNRRIDQSVTQRDSRMFHAPMNMQAASASIGLVLSALAVAVGFFLAWLKPQTSINNVRIGESNGTIFVMNGGKLHPIYNLASARLIVGSPDNPEQIKSKEIEASPRGLPLGIIDAPSVINQIPTQDSQFTVCYSSPQPDSVGDVVTGTTVIAGPLNNPTPPGDNDAVLVWDPKIPGPHHQRQMWMIYHDTRAVFNPADSGIVSALGSQNAAVMSISEQLFNTIPVSDPLILPPIDHFGAPPRWSAKYLIGQIGRVVDPQGKNNKYFLVTSRGLAPISPLVETALQNANDRSKVVDLTAHESVTFPPAEYNAQQFPSTPPHFLSNAVLCESWQKKALDNNSQKHFYSLTGLPIREDQKKDIVRYHPINNTSMKIADQGYVQPGFGWYVFTTDNDAGPIVRKEAPFYIADTGVSYGLPLYGQPGSESGGQHNPADALGLGDPLPAPAEMVDLFPQGTPLTQANALTEHEHIPVDAHQVPIPKDMNAH